MKPWVAGLVRLLCPWLSCSAPCGCDLWPVPHMLPPSACWAFRRSSPLLRPPPPPSCITAIGPTQTGRGGSINGTRTYAVFALIQQLYIRYGTGAVRTGGLAPRVWSVRRSYSIHGAVRKPRPCVWQVAWCYRHRPSPLRPLIWCSGTLTVTQTLCSHAAPERTFPASF